MNTYPIKTSPAKPKAVGAAILFTDADGRILVVHGIGKRYWNLPGGGVEEGESPYRAALREAGEEIGLRVSKADFVCVDYRLKDSGEETIGFLFKGAILSSEQIESITLQELELDEYRLLMPEDAYKILNPALTKRIQSMLANPDCFYLENGNSPIDY